MILYKLLNKKNNQTKKKKDKNWRLFFTPTVVEAYKIMVQYLDLKKTTTNTNTWHAVQHHTISFFLNIP